MTNEKIRKRENNIMIREGRTQKIVTKPLQIPPTFACIVNNSTYFMIMLMAKNKQRMKVKGNVNYITFNRFFYRSISVVISIRNCWREKELQNCQTVVND